jgi:hypothetical protein
METGWMTIKKQIILACVLPLIAVFMIYAVLTKIRAATTEEAAAQHGKKIRPAEVINNVNGKDEVKIKPLQTAEIEKKAPNQGSIETTAGNDPRQSGLGQQHPLANIYFDIATKFADQQLWQIALAYYHRVYEIDPDNPVLAAKIAEMKSEIKNQTTYEKGEALIREELYEEGIAVLRNVAQKSFYFRKAAQVIIAANEKMASANSN